MGHTMTACGKLHCFMGAMLAAGIVFAAHENAHAAGMVPDDPAYSGSAASYSDPLPAPSDPWEFEFRPYGWILFITGDNTLGTEKTSFETNLFDIIDLTDELYAYMGYHELRKGRFGVFADVVWTKTNAGGSAVRDENLIAGLTLDLVADADVWLDIAIIEPGAAFEIARWGPSDAAPNDAADFARSTAIDVLAGARRWWIKTDIDLDLSATIDIPVLGFERTFDLMRTAQETFDWWDPYIGLRLRHRPAPGHELFLRGDIGGFGIGSDHTWQAVGGYSLETRVLGVPVTGYLGYRALYVDYEEGIDGYKFGLDMLWHGPVAGASFRW